VSLMYTWCARQPSQRVTTSLEGIMVNADQQAYTHYLRTIAPEDKCWCGWYPRGECHTCPVEFTCADKLAAQCPDCHNAPIAPGASTISHRIGCAQELSERQE
jgi:hypothetical protein